MNGGIEMKRTARMNLARPLLIAGVFVGAFLSIDSLFVEGLARQLAGVGLLTVLLTFATHGPRATLRGITYLAGLGDGGPGVATADVLTAASRHAIGAGALLGTLAVVYLFGCCDPDLAAPPWLFAATAHPAFCAPLAGLVIGALCLGLPAAALRVAQGRPLPAGDLGLTFLAALIPLLVYVSLFSPR